MATDPSDSPIGIRSSAWPSSSVARSSMAESPRSAARATARRASSAASSSSWFIRSADARRSCTSSSMAGSRIASARAASSVSPSSRSLVWRRVAKASSRVASRTRRSAGVDTTGSACSTSRSASSGALDVEGCPRRIDREARRADGVACRERVLGEHRQAGWGRVAAVEQQVDDRGVDLPATGSRQQVCRELTDLLMREREVGGLALRLREQEARRERRARDRRRASRLRRPRRPARPARRPLVVGA